MCHHRDTLADSVAGRLQEEGYRVRVTGPGRLADLDVALDEESFWVDGSRVMGLLFRASPHSRFSGGFLESDRSFCDAEAGAVWLAGMHLPSVTTLNRYSAAAWCEGARWSVWRRYFLEENVLSCPLVIGEQGSPGMPSMWLPYSSFRTLAVPGPASRAALAAAVGGCDTVRTALCVCGEIVSGPQLESVEQAALLLEKHGIRLAQISLDDQDRVIHVNPFPLIEEPVVLDRACELIVRFYEAHLPLR